MNERNVEALTAVIYEYMRANNGYIDISTGPEDSGVGGGVDELARFLASRVLVPSALTDSQAEWVGFQAQEEYGDKMNAATLRLELERMAKGEKAWP